MGSVSARTPSKSNSNASQLTAGSACGRLRVRQNRFEQFPRYNSLMIKPTEKIWHNGRFIKWDDAKIHVLAHVTSYGSSVFEGVRCYATTAGSGDFPRCASICAGCTIRPRSTASRFPTRSTKLRNAMVEVVRSQQDGILLSPPAGDPRLRRRGRVCRQGQPHRNLHCVLGVGQVSGRRSAWKKVWTCAFRAGRAWLPIPCPLCPRPARTI